VEQQDDFIIPFRGLALEVHRFHYEIDGSFFEELEYTELQGAAVNVDLDLERQERMLVLDFDIRGTVDVPCDRCLDNIAWPVDSRWQLIIKFGEVYEEESDDVIVIPHEQHQIDVTQYLFEYITLMVPIRKVHPDDEDGNSTCNPAMIRILEQHQEHEDTDQRWDALRGLKDDLDSLEH